MLYDPPSGWKYGFPKVWPADLTRDHRNVVAQLIADGYPKAEAEFGARHCRFIGGKEQFE